MHYDVTRHEFEAWWWSLAGNYKISYVNFNMSLTNESVFLLKEEDIDGASLQGKQPKDFILKELKRWLACRKEERTSGSKRDLEER